METDIVLPGQGFSITSKPSNLPTAVSQGHEIGGVSPELKIQRMPTKCDPGHARIGPREPMTRARFKELLPEFKPGPLLPSETAPSGE